MLATIYGTESSVFFVHDEEGHTTFDEEGMKKMNLTTKDVIAPSAVKFNPSDMMIGDYYAQSFYLQDIANLLSTTDFIRKPRGYKLPPCHVYRHKGRSMTLEADKDRS